jgi:hypothetical protein
VCSRSGCHLAGCATAAPRVRIANATAAELATAHQEREVWYHFQAGDVVPFATMFYGAGFGAPETPVAVQAREDFYLVFRKDQPVTISLDGKTRLPMGSTILLVTPSEGGQGGQVNWINYVGRSAEAETELEALLEPVKP